MLNPILKSTQGRTLQITAAQLFLSLGMYLKITSNDFEHL